MKAILGQYNTRKWIKIVSIIASLSFLLALIRLLNVIDSAVFEAFLIVFIPTATIIAFFVLDRQVKFLQNQMRNHETNIQSYLFLQDKINTKLPLNLGGWAADAHFLSYVTSYIKLLKPSIIIEFGSGTSTIVCASLLKKQKYGQIISIDHSEEFASKTREKLDLEGLQDYAQVICSPITLQKIEGKSYHWYSPEFLKLIENKKIDMVVVDGPLGSIQSMARYPAIPHLKQYLSDAFVVLMDDGIRGDEKQIAHEWARILDCKIEYHPHCKGCFVLTKNIY